MPVCVVDVGAHPLMWTVFQRLRWHKCLLVFFFFFFEGWGGDCFVMILQNDFLVNVLMAPSGGH